MTDHITNKDLIMSITKDYKYKCDKCGKVETNEEQKIDLSYQGKKFFFREPGGYWDKDGNYNVNHICVKCKEE